MTNSTEKKVIMIVEDDPFIAMDLEDTFIACGYQVEGPFADVKSGLNSLNNIQPDIAMLDYNLGQETSIPLAKKLHEKKIPFIFLSGQVEKVVIDHDIPKHPVIPKPFVPEKLINLIDNLI